MNPFLRVSTYKHGTRSMEFILDMSGLTGVDRFTPGCLPQKNQLAIHTDVDDFYKKLSSIRINEETFETFCQNVHTTRVKNALKKVQDNRKATTDLKKQEKMKPWNELPEPIKDEYYIKLRHVLESMSAVTFPIGIRPRAKKALKDTITTMTEEELLLYAKMDFSQWLFQQRQNGWIYGETYDKEVRVSPTIREWDELTEEERKDIVEKVRILPVYMKEVNFELYRKPF